MAATDNAYSRLVFWLKILLPLAALAILSTMFLIARTIDPSRAIPYAKVDVNELARDSRVTRPAYSGTTRDGASILVTAAEARPQPQDPGQASATQLAARLITPGGGVTTLHAERGQLDTPANLVSFEGNVKIDTADHYHLTAPHLDAALDRTHVLATGGVTGTAPFGRISAREMRITPDPSAPGTYVTVFKGEVKLVYQPGKKGVTR